MRPWAPSGASPIIAVDLRDDQLELAKQFGATDLINASHTDPVSEIRDRTPGAGLDAYGRVVAGADHVLDCIGSPATTRQAIAAARHGRFGDGRGGSAVLVGIPVQPTELPTIDVLIHEKRILGSMGGSCAPDGDFPILIQWYRDGDIDLDALATVRYPLSAINSAVSDLEHGRIGGRAIIVMGATNDS